MDSVSYRSRFRWREIRRKLLHLAYGLLLASSVYFFGARVGILILTTVLLGGGILSLNRESLPFVDGALRGFERRGEPAGKGPIALTFGILLAAMIFSPIQAFWASFFVSVGDAFSTIATQLLGRRAHKLRNGSLYRKKTWEGLAACFLTNLVPAAAFSGFALWKLLLAASAVAIAETALPDDIDDNAVLPLVAGAFLSL